VELREERKPGKRAVKGAGVEPRGRRGAPSEEFFRSLIDYTLDVITVLDERGRMLYNTPSVTRILGYEPQELENRVCFDFVHPDDLPRVREVFERGIREPGITESVEYRFRHKDGSWRFLESVGENLLDNPVVRGVVVSSHDITDRKRVEEEMRESEEIHRGLVSISPDAIIICDLQGTITYVSPQALRLYGCQSEAELVGRNAIHFIAPEDREKVRTLYQMTLRENAGRSAELTAFRKDGSRSVVELHVTTIRDSEGKPKVLVCFARDITERKRMELELQNRNEELEAFAHTISHDLLTPVAIVEGYAKAALEADAEGRSEAERECLEAIARGARRMSELISSLLQYAQAGHTHEGPLRVDAGEVLTEVLMDLEEEVQNKGVSLVVRDPLPAVRAEAVKLRQVFYNLLSNALKHMGEVEKPRIEVNAAVREGMVTFCVRDNGVGIPESLQGQIFEPFKRFNPDGTGGLGIGLSTVKRAVRSWGGETWVESKPGEGASFFFTALAAE